MIATSQRKALWLWLCPLLVPLCLTLAGWWPKSHVEVSLGSYASLQAGCRASIPALSQAITQYPTASTYTVHWFIGAKPFMTQYDVQEKELWYGPPRKVYRNAVSWSKEWHRVSKEGIHAVAKKKGTLEDLRHYGSDDL